MTTKTEPVVIAKVRWKSVGGGDYPSMFLRYPDGRVGFGNSCSISAWNFVWGIESIEILAEATEEERIMLQLQRLRIP